MDPLFTIHINQDRSKQIVIYSFIGQKNPDVCNSIGTDVKRNLKLNIYLKTATFCSAHKQCKPEEIYFSLFTSIQTREKLIILLYIDYVNNKLSVNNNIS